MGSPVVAASPRKSPSSGRRTNKPLVEKKRRARINGCLGQLKSLILSAMQTDGAQASRLEKADILELTVKYLRHIQRQQVNTAVTSEPVVVAKFSAGYTECATEVIRYMDSVQCVTPEVRTRLESHLVERLRGSVTTSANSAPSAVNTVSSSAYSGCDSTTKLTSEEMSRHYQTAVDLANMAAAVTAKDAAAAAQVTAMEGAPTASTDILSRSVAHTPSVSARHIDADTKDTPRSQSISPSSMGQKCGENSRDSTTSPSSVYDNSCEARRRHSSSEPAVSSTFSSSATPAVEKQTDHVNQDMNNNFAFNKGNVITNGAENVSAIDTVNTDYSSKYYSNHTRNDSNSNNRDYLSAFQRPLHIHIPDSPVPATSPSPPFLHPQIPVTYPHSHGPILMPSSTSTTAVPPPSTATRHGVVDDAPPTILYPCDGYLMTGQTNLSPRSAQQYVFSATPSSTQFENRNLSHCNRNPKFFNNDINTSNYNENGKENDNIVRANNYPVGPSVHRPSHTGSAHVLVDTMLNTSNNYNARAHLQGHRELTHHETVPATPSPPTLTREEFYSAHLLDRNGPHRMHCDTGSRYLATNDERVNVSDACRNKLETSVHLSYIDNDPHQPEPNRNNYYQHEGSCTEFHNPHSQYDYTSYPHQQSNQSSFRATTTTAPTKSNREHPAELATHTTTVNNNGHHPMNGTSPSPRVHSRQNDTSLSPPTLKRRLLFAQGSEGEKMAPRCKATAQQLPRQWDKRENLLQHATGYSEIRRNELDGCETQTTRLCRGGDVPFPAVMCNGPAHAVDDGLWRPW